MANIYAVKTTVGQERNVAEMLCRRVEKVNREAEELNREAEELNHKAEKLKLNREAEKFNHKAEKLKHKAEKEKYNVYSALVSNEIRGYILVEAQDKTEIDKSLRGVSHSRGLVKGKIPFAEVEKFLEPKSIVTKVKQGDIVELISGPFRGEKARVVRVDQKKEKITVELFEATVPIPVTVDGESIRVIKKEVSEDETSG
ncbi:MAG TPA: transcription elongation factor Spt5 [Euryarchaeota archaeon]|nr:transcription elongation factor Spt5 [Euryarchaeota archaeon]